MQTNPRPPKLRRATGTKKGLTNPLDHVASGAPGKASSGCRLAGFGRKSLGINYASFLHLAKLSQRFKPMGRTVMLGRQKFDLKVHRWASRRLFSTALKQAGIDRPITDFV
jgi:hypothetical protein